MPLHLRRFFPVLGRAATPSEPGESAFDHPAARDDFEALGGVGAFDDLHRPAPDLLQSSFQLGSGIAAICEYMTQQRVVGRYGLQQVRRAVAILNIGTMHRKANQEADGIGDDVTLASIDPLAGVIALTPPLSVVLTLWLSITPADGSAARPSAWRAAATSWRFDSSSRPLSRNALMPWNYRT